MFQCGQMKSCSCNFSFPRQSTYFRFVMQAGDLGHGKESAGELQGGTHMHHSCPLVMSQVFVAVSFSRPSKLAHIRSTTGHLQMQRKGGEGERDPAMEPQRDRNC